MGRCKRIQKRFSRYIDRVASAKEHALIEDHLETCEGCRRELSELRTVWRLLEQWREPAVPRDMAARFWARADEALPPKQPIWLAVFTRSLPAWASAAVALVLGLLVGVYLGILLGKPAVSQTAALVSPPENMREVAYLGDIPSESFAEAYITLVSDDTNVENGTL